MAEIITATFINGAFVPEHAILFPPGTRVELVVKTVKTASTSAAEALRLHTPPTEEQLASFNAICDKIGQKVRGFKHRTRDELHERR